MLKDGLLPRSGDNSKDVFGCGRLCGSEVRDEPKGTLLITHHKFRIHTVQNSKIMVSKLTFLFQGRPRGLVDDGLVVPDGAHPDTDPARQDAHLGLPPRQLDGARPQRLRRGRVRGRRPKVQEALASLETEAAEATKKGLK